MMAFFEILRAKNPMLFWYGLACFMLAGLCLVLSRVSPVQLLGTSPWLKPFKFFLSTTLYLWAMAWYLQVLGENKSVSWFNWAILVLFTLENGYIFIQAIRGEMSHFNISTPFLAKMWGMMALAAIGISVCTAAVGAGFFTQNLPEVPLVYLWGIRLGIVLFVVFSMEGLAMGARMAHTVGAADGGPGLPVVNWSRNHGDLRIAHFVGMHALQIVPLFAWFFGKNVRDVVIFASLYAVLSSYLFLQAMAGRPFFNFGQ